MVPLNNVAPLGKRSSDGVIKHQQTETQSLRATTLAFILGKRSNQQAPRGNGDRSEFPGTQYAAMNSIMPGMPGTE